MKTNLKRSLRQQVSPIFYSLIDDVVARVMKAKAALSGHARTMTEM